MSDWTAGYVADIGYTFGYYPELHTLRSRLPLTVAGLATPARFATACELGFGQGVGVNIHAAAGDTEWWGTDFNPAHAANAREMAEASGSGAHLFDESFEEFCRRDDLPGFDFIALHGTWSWISEENRRVIVDFLRRKLNVGGVFYVSYNTLPGWAPMVPMRHLLTECARTVGAPGQPLVERIDAALDFADRLLALDPGYARANPQAAERLKKLRTQDRNYLAHEYFNRDWHPMSFADMAGWLEGAKLGYAGSANYLSHIDALNGTPEQLALLKGITDPVFRETVRDHIGNQQFRRDYWVRGARQLSALQVKETIGRMSVMLLRPAADVSMTLSSAEGAPRLAEGIYMPLVEALADHAVQTVDALAARVKDKGVSFAAAVQAVMVLASRGDITVVQDGAVTAARKPHTERLTAWLLDRARSTQGILYLPSPVSGGALPATRMQQLCLAAHLRGARNVEQLARACWQVLAMQEQRLQVKGRTLATEQENLDQLRGEAKVFLEQTLPLLRLLQIAPA